MAGDHDADVLADCFRDDAGLLEVLWIVSPRPEDPWTLRIPAGQLLELGRKVVHRAKVAVVVDQGVDSVNEGIQGSLRVDDAVEELLADAAVREEGVVDAKDEMPPPEDLAQDLLWLKELLPPRKGHHLAARAVHVPLVAHDVHPLVVADDVDKVPVRYLLHVVGEEQHVEVQIQALPAQPRRVYLVAALHKVDSRRARPAAGRRLLLLATIVLG